MRKIDTLLFDFDGVIADTESQYTRFWREYFSENSNVNPEELALKVKGTPLKKIFETYFSGLGEDEFARLTEKLAAFEKTLDYSPIRGVVEFIEAARARGFKTGLVTSSGANKMRSVFEKTQYGKLFDTLITAQDITVGKPDPMCYLLGAKRLESAPENCAVFEDSLTGLKAGRSAGMFVIGLLTTFPRAQVEPLSDVVIGDFADASAVFAILNGAAQK